MRVVVTGAGGFVGRALVKRLLAEHDVEVISVTRSLEPRADRVLVVNVDLAHPGWTGQLPEQADAVIALHQSRHYAEFPEGTLDVTAVNIAATVELLDWSRRAGVRRFVMASTGNVYEPSHLALSEDSVCNPTGFYGASKLAAEHIARPYGSVFEVVIARLFGIYGPDQSAGLFRSLYNSVDAGRPVTLASGTGLRLTPLFMDDCTEALTRLASVPLDQRITIANVASSEQTDVNEITAIMGELLNKPVNVSDRSGQPMSLIADARRLAALLGWRPAVSLREGISRMVRSFE